MSAIDKLTEKFRDFPGIGQRQASRFVYFLLTRNPNYLDELSRLIVEIKNEVHKCNECQRFYPGTKKAVCSICGNTMRDQSSLMVVEKDIDLSIMEKSNAFNGLYFVLGGTVPLSEQNPESRVRGRELINRVENLLTKGLKEIVLAFSVNAEGENTTRYVEDILKPLQETNDFAIYTLGRGLSTGTELEYADGDTLREAFRHRERAI